jgi:hypothetical protein
MHDTGLVWSGRNTIASNSMNSSPPPERLFQPLENRTVSFSKSCGQSSNIQVLVRRCAYFCHIIRQRFTAYGNHWMAFHDAQFGGVHGQRR